MPASDTLLFAYEINRGSLRYTRSELQGVPIRQTHASVRLRLADFARLWGAMNAVAFTCQTNPNDTHWIVGTRFDCEWLRSPNAFECVGRIVMVRGILLYSRYLQSAAWGWLLPTSHGRRIVGQQFATSVERPQLLLGLSTLMRLTFSCNDPVGMLATKIVWPATSNFSPGLRADNNSGLM